MFTTGMALPSRFDPLSWHIHEMLFGFVMAAVAGFLLWNWPPAKIFMGDVGSTYLGFMLFAFCLVSVGEGWQGNPADRLD